MKYIAILGIWIGVGISAFAVGDAVVTIAFLAMLTTLIIVAY